jgi:hypothetical protein
MSLLEPRHIRRDQCVRRIDHLERSNDLLAHFPWHDSVTPSIPEKWKLDSARNVLTTPHICTVCNRIRSNGARRSYRERYE